MVCTAQYKIRYMEGSELYSVIIQTQSRSSLTTSNRQYVFQNWTSVCNIFVSILPILFSVSFLFPDNHRCSFYPFAGCWLLWWHYQQVLLSQSPQVGDMLWQVTLLPFQSSTFFLDWLKIISAMIQHYFLIQAILTSLGRQWTKMGNL